MSTAYTGRVYRAGSWDQRVPVIYAAVADVTNHRVSLECQWHSPAPINPCTIGHWVMMGST